MSITGCLHELVYVSCFINLSSGGRLTRGIWHVDNKPHSNSHHRCHHHYHHDLNHHHDDSHHCSQMTHTPTRSYWPCWHERPQKAGGHRHLPWWQRAPFRQRCGQRATFLRHSGPRYPLWHRHLLGFTHSPLLPQPGSQTAADMNRERTIFWINSDRFLFTGKEKKELDYTASISDDYYHVCCETIENVFLCKKMNARWTYAAIRLPNVQFAI